MWKLTENLPGKRTYVNSATNSQCEQTKVYTDKDGNSWWEFDLLTAIPFTRQLAATQITALYTLGLSKVDLSSYLTGIKAILRSQDKEKYDKAMAMVLDFEQKADMATDAIKQIIAMVPVYFTINDEIIDSFDSSIQAKKMSILEVDPEMHNFFLNKLIDRTERLMNFSNQISQIASQPMGELLVPMQ